MAQVHNPVISVMLAVEDAPAGEVHGGGHRHAAVDRAVVAAALEDVEDERRHEAARGRIDVDGNDYWIWEAVESARPLIVVVEYNSVFGRDRAVRCGCARPGTA